MNQVGLKELRQNISKFADKVKRGQEFIVMRKSQPLFKISPLNFGEWEEVVDFTKIKKSGIEIDELISRL